MYDLIWLFLSFHFCIHFRCGLPVCNEACETGYLHQNYECPLFAKAFEMNEKGDNSKNSKLPKIENLYAPCPLYTCITPLRMLLREWNAEKTQKELVSFILN